LQEVFQGNKSSLRNAIETEPSPSPKIYNFINQRLLGWKTVFLNRSIHICRSGRTKGKWLWHVWHARDVACFQVCRKIFYYL